MKIKLFNREAISDSYYSNGMARYRRENNKELEVRVNEFMADKKVVDIKYQEATHGNYEDMDPWLYGRNVWTTDNRDNINYWLDKIVAILGLV